MADNKYEAMEGDSLQKKARNDRNVLQRLGCSWSKVAIICLILILLVVIVALSVTVASLQKEGAESKAKAESTSSGAPPVVEQAYIATNGQPFPYKKIRLPKNVTPLHYNIFMHPNISQSNFIGKVSIYCHALEETDFVLFHIKNLTISSLGLKETETGNQLHVKYHLEYTTNELVYVKLGTSLEAGTNLTVEVEFEGELSNGMDGFYKSSYRMASGETRYLATTHFEPTNARAAFPCMDEPSLKATFDLTMVRDPGFWTLFNMPLKNTSDFPGGLKRDTFQTSARMSTYLVAFIVCDFERRTKQTKRNITVGVNAPKEMIGSMAYALDATVKILEYYEDFFGVNYPLPKLDIAAIPDLGPGGTENWGLITFHLNQILYDPVTYTETNKMRATELIAHEIAHLWFGDLVTMMWWNDIWLKEGLVSYLQYLAIESTQIQSDWNTLEMFWLEDRIPALREDSLRTSHPISMPVDNPNQIDELYDDISYHKGAAIVGMLREYIGHDAFKKGLSSYLKTYEYGNAVDSDLWRALSQASPGEDIPAMMSTWTEQMGYPVITLTSRGNKVTVTQSRFLMDNNSNITSTLTSPYGYVWEVPFTYVTSVDQNNIKKLLLKDKSGSFEIPAGSDWIKGNYGMFGFYRVNYDESNWKRLIRALHANHTIFSPSERAGLIDDIFTLARAGHLNYTIAFDLSGYMVKERAYLPWKALFGSMTFLESRLENGEVYELYRRYMLKLMGGFLNTPDMLWEDNGATQKFLAETVLTQALHFEYLPVVQKGKQLFNDWKKNNTKLSKNLRSVVFKAGIQYGFEDDWDFVWNSYLTENVTSEKLSMLDALGTTRDSRLLSRLLKYGLDTTKFRSQDTISVFIKVTGSCTGQLVAWRFFKQNWHIFRDRYGSAAQILPLMIEQITAFFDTEIDYDEDFFRTRDAGSGARAVTQTLERIRNRINWSQKYEGIVTELLQNQ